MLRDKIEQKKKELQNVLREQNDCLNEYDIVKSWRRYDYAQLGRKARELKEKIDFAESLV